MKLAKNKEIGGFSSVYDEDDDDNDDDYNDGEDDETDQAKIEGCSSVNGEGEGDVHVSPGVVASRAEKSFYFCFLISFVSSLNY